MAGGTIEEVTETTIGVTTGVAQGLLEAVEGETTTRMINSLEDQTVTI